METANEIQPRKWYYRMMGFAGNDSCHVAPFRPLAGVMTGGPGCFRMFGSRSGETLTPLPRVQVWEAIGEDGRTYRIDANDLSAIGIGSLREAFDFAPDLTDEKLSELQELGRKKAAEEKAAKEQAAKDHAEAVAKCRRKYSYLPNKGTYLRVAKVAQNLRVELKRTFPGVKFSVTSKSFSMGDDIDVQWNDGPTQATVEAVAGKYQHSHADMETGDYWDYDPSAFNEVFGGTKFLFCSRKMSDETQAVLYAGIGNECRADWDKRQAIFNVFARSPLPIGAKVTGIAYSEAASEKRVTYAEPPTPEDRGTIFGINVTVSENREKHGIEIRFAERPPAETLENLKAHGWRWSRFSGCWYTRASDEARTFAEEIAAAV